MKLPPVVEQNGLKYFAVNTSRGTGYARAKTVGGRRYYADDYPVSQEQPPDEFIEPDDLQWLRMMK